MASRTPGWRVVFGGALVSTLLTLGAVAQDDDLVFRDAPKVLVPGKQLLLDITRAGSRLVAVGASGLVIYSDDSGTSWIQASVPVSATLTSVDFVDEQKGWAVGHAEVILHSADGGESWTLQHDGRDSSQALLEFAGARRAALEEQLDVLDASEEGADSDARYDVEYALEDAIFLEEDAQTAIETGPADPLLDVRFVDAERGFAAGAYGAFLRTVDGGKSWVLEIGGLDNPDRFHYYSILPTANQGLFLIGEAGLLFRSVDGGEVFSRYDGVYDGSLFGAVESRGRVLAFGLRGNQFSYNLEGDDWTALDESTGYSLYGGTVLDDGRLLLLGANGALTERTPDGLDTQLLHPSRATLVAAATASDGRVWLVGMAGLVNL
ncbi:MAG: YCF48-related protein, partial [Pseudomonadota bacterium]